MTPLEIALVVIGVPLYALSAWLWWRILYRICLRDFAAETLCRIHRLEETAERHFRLATELRTAGQDDAGNVRLALAASNAAWDLRRRSHMEELP